jgi:hypothetical protein
MASLVTVRMPARESKAVDGQLVSLYCQQGPRRKRAHSGASGARFHGVASASAREIARATATTAGLSTAGST